MKLITAKFSSYCAETGAKIKKGDQVYYDYLAKKVYALTSKKAQSFASGQSIDGAGAMAQANEEAYFDSFCQRNNI